VKQKQPYLLAKHFNRRSISRQVRIFNPVIVRENLQMKWWKLKTKT